MRPELTAAGDSTPLPTRRSPAIRHRGCERCAPVRRHTPAGADVDSVFDVRAVFQQHHRGLALADLPSLLVPHKGRYGLVDYEKAFTPDPRSDVFELRGIDRAQGALVVVRPDQYVSHVLPLDAYAELAAFFAPLLIQPRRRDGVRQSPR